MNELYIYAAADIIYLMRGRGCSSYVNSLNVCLFVVGRVIVFQYAMAKPQFKVGKLSVCCFRRSMITALEILILIVDGSGNSSAFDGVTLLACQINQLLPLTLKKMLQAPFRVCNILRYRHFKMW